MRFSSIRDVFDSLNQHKKPPFLIGDGDLFQNIEILHTTVSLNKIHINLVGVPTLTESSIIYY